MFGLDDFFGGFGGLVGLDQGLRDYNEDQGKALAGYNTYLKNLAGTDVEARNLATGDPFNEAAQRGAVTGLANVAGSQGLGPQDLATMRESQGLANANLQGQRGAALQQLAQKGLIGAGTNLQADIGAQQTAANSAANAGSNAVASARNRALQAMAQTGQLASMGRGQTLQQQGQGNAIQMFNANQRLAKVQGQLPAYQGIAGIYGQKANTNLRGDAALGQGWGNWVGSMGNSVAGALG